MRRPVHRLLTAALAALVAAPALGQLIPGMVPILDEGFGAPILLMNKGVQKEIKLSDEQRDKFAKIVRGVHDKYQPDIRKAAAARDQKKLLELMHESTAETRDKVAKAIPDVLADEQARRLKQIEVQVNGVLSFTKPDVQRQLKLTERQKDEVRRINDGLKQDVAEVFKDAASNPIRKAPEAARKARELRDAATAKAVALLDDDQKKTWKELTGPRFDFKLDLLSRPGGR